MTDRELLEMAAKATGIPLQPDFAERYDHYMADKLMWNPLIDDGDALRLAVVLQIDVSQSGSIGIFGEPFTAVVCHWNRNRGHGDVACWVSLGERIRDDKFVATRRSIVRAAAEIGKGIP
jgi:hypothetical protein